VLADVEAECTYIAAVWLEMQESQEQLFPLAAVYAKNIFTAAAGTDFNVVAHGLSINRFFRQ
jgi:hypothetical protein